MIIRESESFSLLVPAGAVSTSQLVLLPQDTQTVKVVYKPNKMGTDRGKLVLKPQGKKVGGKSFKASIIQMEGLEEVETNRYQLACQQLPAKKLVRFVNKGETTGFVKITSGGDAPEDKLDITPSAFLLGAGCAKDVFISYLGQEDGTMCSPLVAIFTGPELVRQILKRARLLPGAARLSDNPSLMGISFSEDFPGEEMYKVKEDFNGQLTALDVKHFYQKTVKHLVSLTMPHRPADFDQLVVEETLSETRIDQSIALPLHTTHMTCSSLPSHQTHSMGARPANLNLQHSRFPTQAKSSTFSSQMPNSPPTSDSQSHLMMIPRHLSIPSGEEAIFKLVNQSSQPVHWDLSWPSSKLTISPGAGMLSPHGQDVVCVQAVLGQSNWRGQVSVYSDNSMDSVEVVVTAVASSTCITVSNDQVELGVAVLVTKMDPVVVLPNT